MSTSLPSGDNATFLRFWSGGTGVWRAAYWPGVGLAAGVAVEVGDPLAVDDAEGEPLGTGVTIGVGLGDGKIVLGTFANERANISTNMTKTITTQMRPRLSLRGGSEPR